MRKNLQYRIAEYCGKFRIEVYAYNKSGFLWSRRIEGVWMPTNAWGNVWRPSPIKMPRGKVFDSLEDAKRQVQNWQRDPVPVYHVCE